MSAIFGFILGIIVTVILAILALFGFVATAVPADQGEIAIATVQAEPAQTAQLVDATWLRDELDSNPDLVVVALMPEDQFVDGHIPGAVQVDRAQLAITDTAEATIATWETDVEALLTDLGITRDSTVVVYDDGSHDAARLWWVLTQLSHPSVALLDGGLTAWTDLGEAVQAGPADPTPALVPYVGVPNEQALVTKQTVESALNDPGIVIVDARPANEYAAGHIPGAINIPMEANYAPDGTLLSIDELQAVYLDAGVPPTRWVIVYCNSGVRASNDFFAMTYLGYPQVSLYAGSWPEWSSDPSLPVEP